MKDRGKTLIFSTHQMETVEELCEAIAILDRGRVVVGGNVRDVRRSSGRQVVRLGRGGDPEIGWLETLDGVRVTRRRSGLHRGGDREGLRSGARFSRPLWPAAARSSTSRIADPSLEEIFIEQVGQMDTS